MMIARAADKLLQKLIPQVKASAFACSNCAVAYTTCAGGRIVEHLYRLKMIHTGCKPVGAFCSTRRTPDPC
jgi:hypothetical protein